MDDSESEHVLEAAVAVVTPMEQARHTINKPEPHEPSPLFDETNKELEERKLRRELYIVLALACLVVAVVVVTVSVIATGGKKKQIHQTKSPTRAPTMAPTIGVTLAQQRLDLILSQLANNTFTANYTSTLPTSASQLEENSNTPMAQATQWLVHSDKLVNEDNLMRRLTLATIYYQNGGSKWSNTSNWLSKTKHHCEWYGVTCCSDVSEQYSPTCVSANDVDAIMELNLSGNQLKGQVTPIFAQLTDLRRLDLSYNSFTGTLPCSALGSLPSLMSLYLQHNTFTGELDYNLRQNGVLQTLFVQRNNFTGEWPKSFCPLCPTCSGNVDVFGLDCDEVSCNDNCCTEYNHCYYD
ncbi:hypothetical protein MPSEU_000687300 [Mayamaea pseudoterrestris]|nr:hypothetical protein MPSEU_000687300 [Mayamaea pseudoterrestris]